MALSADSVFVSASLGPRGQQAALYRGPKAGGPFQRCSDGLPEWFSTNVDTACIAARGTFVAVGDPEGTVYVSEDDGATWTVAESGLPSVTCVEVLES